jgi:DNA-binding HxlR family transcriptional regulator
MPSPDRPAPRPRTEAFAKLGFTPQNCPIRDVMDQVSGKWASLLLLELMDGPLRFGAIRRRIPDISQRMLTQTLRDLQRDGYVSRTVFPTQPPSVEYRLTGQGQSFSQLLVEMAEWAAKHHAAIKQSREIYDGAEAA